MPPELIILAATALLVFMRAVQQLNVIHHHYVLAAITPYFIACGEVASVIYVVQVGWPAVPWVGTGGAIGVTLAMTLHKRLREWLARPSLKNGA
jgi:hypothetical protein